MGLSIAILKRYYLPDLLRFLVEFRISTNLRRRSWEIQWNFFWVCEYSSFLLSSITPAVAIAVVACLLPMTFSITIHTNIQLLWLLLLKTKIVLRFGVVVFFFGRLFKTLIVKPHPNRIDGSLRRFVFLVGSHYYVWLISFAHILYDLSARFSQSEWKNWFSFFVPFALTLNLSYHLCQFCKIFRPICDSWDYTASYTTRNRCVFDV